MSDAAAEAGFAVLTGSPQAPLHAPVGRAVASMTPDPLDSTRPGFQVHPTPGGPDWGPNWEARARSCLDELTDRARELQGEVRPCASPLDPDRVHAAVAKVLAAVSEVASAIAECTREGPDPGQPRGALRFRDVAVLNTPSDSSHGPAATKPRTVLPASRAAEARPYRRPIMDRFNSGDRSFRWEEAVSGTQPIQRSIWRQAPLAACAVMVAGVGLGIADLTRGRPANQAPAGPPMAPVPPPLSPVEQMGIDVLQARPEIERIIRAFHNAVTPEEKSGFIRRGATLLTTLRRYYATHPPEAPVSEFFHDTFNWVQIGGRAVVYGLVASADGTTHQFTVELAPDGCRLDWQALTGWKGTEWNEFLERRPGQPVTMCVTATPDTLFAEPFTDPQEWICLRVEDVSRIRPAWAYVRRNSPVAGKLPAGFRGSLPFATDDLPAPAPRRMTVELRFPPQAPPLAAAMVEMTGLHHDGWFDPTLGDPHP